MGTIRIFISSVQQEFSSERKSLAQYIRRDAFLGKFFEVFIYEEMPAKSQSAAQVYLSEVEQTDIYLALIGANYGYEDSEGFSPTEREFDLATQLHKDRLIYIKLIDEDKRHTKEKNFIKKIEQCVVRQSFGDYEELRSAVYTSLVRYLEENDYLRFSPFDATLHPTATLEDIDIDKVDIFVERARRKRAYPLSKDTGVERVLKSLNLIDNGKITNACLLLFGKSPQKFFPTSEVKCVQFYTNTISKPLASYQVFHGSLFEMIDNAVSFVMSHIDARVGERNKRAEVDIDFELPLKSVTESIVNSICHRDYTSNGSVQVMLFPNRLEIWNPGRLPLGITTAQLSLPHTSIPANPVLANPLYLAGYIERLGTGTSDMVDECIAMGLKAPDFIQDSNFRAILWRKNALTSDKNALTSDENALTSDENALTSDENALTSDKNALTSDKNTLTSDKNALTSDKNALTSDKNALTSDKNALTSNENALSANFKFNKKQKMVLEYCSRYARSGNEIFQHLGIVNQSRSREKYITQLILAGFLRPTKPKLNDPDQKYITTVGKE